MLTPARAAGWAQHPGAPGYCCLVNVVHRSVVVRTVIADLPCPPDAPEGARGFTVDLRSLALSEPDAAALMVLIGETDEWIAVPATAPADPHAMLTVETILASSLRRREWVTGATHLDAERAGLTVETIVDMLYRDMLGRPGDANGLAHYAAAVRSRALGYDDIRRAFIASDEFRLRRKYADMAPGVIFSRRIVFMAAPGDFAETGAVVTPHTVSVAALLALDGADLVGSAYRQILRKEPDAGGLAHYVHQLNSGMPKMRLIRHLAALLEAITLGVCLVDLTPEDAE